MRVQNGQMTVVRPETYRRQVALTLRVFSAGWLFFFLLAVILFWYALRSYVAATNAVEV